MREAERAYFLLSTELVAPRQDIDLVLSDAADFSNGAANVFPVNRIVLLLTPPASEPDLQNFDDWVRTILVHELTHIFHLDRVKGPWGVLQSVVGRAPGSFPNLYQPSWVSEGIATYYESHFTSRGRLRGSFHTEILLAAARSDRWPRPNEATYISEKWPDGVSPYAFGSRFFGRLAGDAGDSTIPLFIEATSGQWIPFRTGRPLRLSTGIRRDSLWNALAADYEERAHARPGSEVQPMVRGEFVERLRGQPSLAIANDGSLAWFSSPPDEAQSILVRKPDGTEKRYLTTGGVDLTWSGDTLYATRLELTDPATYRSDLHRLVGGQWEQVTHGRRLTDIASAPGYVVAVQLTENGNRLADVVGDTIIPIPEDRPGVTFASPAVDSSFRTVVIEHNPRGYLFRGYGWLHDPLIYTAGSNEILADPVWVASDSLTFLFVSDRTGLPQIYWIKLGDTARQVTDEPVGARQPALSPDGWLYFTALESDGYALKRLPWRTGGPADQTGRTGGPADRRTGDSVNSQAGGQLETLGTPPSAGPPVRLSAYSPWSALRPHYFIPYLVDKGNAGYFLGAFTSGTDPIGRFSYAARVAGGFKGGRVDASLSMVYRRWNRHSLDLYIAQDNGDAGVITAPFDATVTSRERDAELGFSTSWRRWYRSLTLRVAGDYEEDRFTSSPSVEFINPRFVAASVGLGLSRTILPPLAISVEDGASLSVRYRRRWRQDQDGWSDEWRTRLAFYTSIKGVGGFAHPVLAARVSAATSSGPDRETFGIGGASGVTYQPLPGIVAGSGRQFPVRGFDGGELRGGTVAVGTAELRVPVALVAKPFWELPYGLDKVSLRLFYDYGRVWDAPAAGPPDWIHSAGVEITWDLVVLYDVPLRLRTGAAVPLRDGSATRRGEVRFGVGFGSEF